MITTLSHFRDALNTHVENYLHNTFHWTTVERWIDNILKKNVEDIVMTALGYENNSFDRGWKLRQGHHDKSGIQTVIQDMAKKHAQELLPGFIEAKQKAIDKRINSATFKKDIVEMYSSTLNTALREAMREWVERHAAPVVAELFDRHGEEYAAQIKLKCPLTMDSILLIAEGK